MIDETCSTIETANATGPSACPVAALAEEMRHVVAAYDKADEENDDRARDALWANLEAIRARVSTQRAQSFEGALFQIAIAHGDLDTLTSFVAGPDRGLAVNLQSRIGRLLYSASWIIRQLGEVEATQATEYFMSLQYDPHDHLEAARCAPSQSRS